MQPQELNEREKSILRLIVQQFILTASPVGSRNIVKKYDVGVSPATVRNIMSDLEDFGFIGHPHTSAGRIPTDRGYRMYVDSLMDLQALNDAAQQALREQIESAPSETDELLKIVSRLLSDITNQLACVMYPKLDTGILEKIQLLQITSQRVLVVITISSGLVKTITIETDLEIGESQLQSVQSLLNERLSGLALSEIRLTFAERMQDVHPETKTVLRVFLDSADKLFADTKLEDKLYFNGARHLLKQPEFENPGQFQSVIELIEDKDIIIHILEKSADPTREAVQIMIGSEAQNEKLSNYSLVSKEYHAGNTHGILGIIGPKRMEYAKIVAIVDYISGLLTEMLTRR